MAYPSANSQPMSTIQGPTPVQKAIQTLSLRMPPRRDTTSQWPFPPEFYGAQGQGTGSGTGGTANNPQLLELIRRMLFGEQPPMGYGTPLPSATGPAVGAPPTFGAPPMPRAPGMAPGPMGGSLGTQPLPRSPAMPTTP